MPRTPFAVLLATLLVTTPRSAAAASSVCGFVDIGAPLAPVSLGSVAWGDFDNDGDLDILLTGQINSGRVAKVYRNDGGAFTDIAAPLTGVYFSSVAWGDYDNDADLDVLLTGYDGSVGITKVYRNESGALNDIAAPFPSVLGTSVAWGDHDNDGDLDFLHTGFDASFVAFAKLYRNDGGTFTDIGASLPGVAESSVAWGDHDNDGDLDILLAGDRAPASIAKVCRNDGDAVFTDLGALLPGVENCSVAWGDYDNDGDLDILLTGLSVATRVAKVFRNDGGAFIDIAAPLTPVENSSAAWGDHDNDGDLDILLTGLSDAGRIAKIYRNDNGVFADIAAPLTGVESSSVAWGDCDNDGDLDILLTGATLVGRVAKIYRNDGCAPNTPPAAPGALSSSAAAGTATFNWSASTDAQTPAPGLHYNLRVGTTPGGSEISSAMASAGGHRRVTRLGNAQQSGWKLKLPVGTYYWSVQAIDAAFAGSPFAAEETLTVAAVDVPNPLPAAFALHASRPNPFSSFSVIRFDLPHPARVMLRIYDAGGREVRTLANGSWPAGRHQVEWDGTARDGRRAPAGVYYCAIEADGFRNGHSLVRLN